MAKRVIVVPDLEHAEARAKIARTREALARKLGVLTNRLFGTTNPSNEGKRENMVAKKSDVKSSSARGGAKTQKSKKSPAKKRSSKANQVMGEMLAGAAIGAVKGTAEALPPPPGNPNSAIDEIGCIHPWRTSWPSRKRGALRGCFPKPLRNPCALSGTLPKKSSARILEPGPRVLAGICRRPPRRPAAESLTRPEKPWA